MKGFLKDLSPWYADRCSGQSRIKLHGSKLMSISLNFNNIYIARPINSHFHFIDTRIANYDLCLHIIRMCMLEHPLQMSCVKISTELEITVSTDRTVIKCCMGARRPSSTLPPKNNMFLRVSDMQVCSWFPMWLHSLTAEHVNIRRKNVHICASPRSIVLIWCWKAAEGLLWEVDRILPRLIL